MKKIFAVFYFCLLLILNGCNKKDQSGYNCLNGTCSAALENPQYLSLADCQSVCGNGNNVTSGYNCVNGTCTYVSSNAQYSSLSSCQISCSNSSNTIGIPTLTIPQNGANNVWSPFTYSWSSVAGATAYDLYGYYYTTNNQQSGFAINYSLSTNSFSFTNQLTSSFAGKVIYWKVRAKNNSITGEWSSTYSYTLNN